MACARTLFPPVSHNAKEVATVAYELPLRPAEVASWVCVKFCAHPPHVARVLPRQKANHGVHAHSARIGPSVGVVSCGADPCMLPWRHILWVRRLGLGPGSVVLEKNSHPRRYTQTRAIWLLETVLNLWRWCFYDEL